MNKWIVAILVSTLAVSGGIGAFYLYRAPGQTVSELFSTEKALDWQDVKSAITKNCRELDAVFINSDDGPKYASDFLTRLRARGFIKNNQILSYQNIPSDADKRCLLVWTSNNGQNKKIAYETKSGEIQEFTVKNFSLNELSSAESLEENRAPAFEYTGVIRCEESADGCAYKFTLDNGSTHLVILDDEDDVEKITGLVGSRVKILGQLRKTDIIVLEIQKL